MVIRIGDWALSTLSVQEYDEQSRMLCVEVEDEWERTKAFYTPDVWIETTACWTKLVFVCPFPRVWAIFFH